VRLLSDTFREVAEGMSSRRAAANPKVKYALALCSRTGI
jgi:hypothetical protein